MTGLVYSGYFVMGVVRIMTCLFFSLSHCSTKLQLAHFTCGLARIQLLFIKIVFILKLRLYWFIQLSLVPDGVSSL